jgi:hypothetical protein
MTTTSIDLPTQIGNGGTGQKVSAASQSVVLASDQGAIPISGTLASTTSFTYNGTTSTVVTWSATPANNVGLPVVILSGEGAAALDVGVAAPTTATLRTASVLYGTNGANIYSIKTDANGNIITSNPTGFTFNGTANTSPVSSTTPANNVGLPIVALAGQGLAPFDVGVAAAGSATLRVAAIMQGYTGSAYTPVLTDGSGKIQVSNTSGAMTKQNAPYRNDCSSVNIATGSYTQVIASTTGAINLIKFWNGTGVDIIFATGSAGSEVEQFRVPPGGDDFQYSIPASSRVSIQPTTTLTSGILIVNFLG